MEESGALSRLASKPSEEGNADASTMESLLREPFCIAALQFVLLAVLWVFVEPGLVSLMAGVSYAVVVWIFLNRALRRSGIGAFGPANWITLVRATLVGGVVMLVTGALVGDVSGISIAVLATLALMLDAVDGRVARRTGTVTDFGARFDMEVDAVLILVLSVYSATIFGAWVIAIGAMRYVFVAFYLVVPWLRAQLPPSQARKVVCAIQGIVLVATGSGYVPYPLALALIVVSLALLTWSFGRDVLWLRRENLRRDEVTEDGSVAKLGASLQEITDSATDR